MRTLRISIDGPLGNDGDADGDSLTASLVSGPGHGALVMGPTGNFVYTPSPNFFGNDSFTYRASDGLGGFATADEILEFIREFL